MRYTLSKSTGDGIVAESSRDRGGRPCRDGGIRGRVRNPGFGDTYASDASPIAVPETRFWYTSPLSSSEFFPALQSEEDGVRIAGPWSQTARRLNDDFAVSIGYITGKRCLGGMLELLTHCHYLVSEEGATLGMPEVTLPVVPGMEGCHWPFRKTGSGEWPMLVRLLLNGAPVRAGEAVGWLIDYAGPREEALKTAWSIATGGSHGLPRRELESGVLQGLPTEIGGLADSGDPATEAARRAIMDSIQISCRVTLNEALSVQTKLSAEFMTTPHCKKGRVGAEYARTVIA